jgi:hypothetical protein
MAKISSGGAYAGNNYAKRPGVHSKNNTSKNKQSKNYKKQYKGQGR